MLRRSIGTLTLPERCDLVSRLDFANEERALYEKIQHRTLQPITINSQTEYSFSNQPTILEMINKLRRICNLGMFMKDEILHHQESTHQVWNVHEAQEVFNSLVAANVASCKLCSADLGSAATEVADHAQDNTCHPAVFRCGFLICGPCRFSEKSNQCECTKCGPHTAFQVSTMSSTNQFELQAELTEPQMPTKIRAVMADLGMNAIKEKWFVKHIRLQGLQNDLPQYSVLFLDIDT